MARATEWRRRNNQFVGGGMAAMHKNLLCSLTEGETFTRVRWNWQALHSAISTPAEAVGFTAVCGIIAVPGGTPEGNVPPPLTSVNAEWIDWSGANFVPFQVDISAPSSEIDIAPGVQTERDSKAQRLAPAGGLDIWISSETSNAQSIHYLGYNASCLILLPA